MKFFKGVIICLVLCFATYGVFSFLKKPPVLSVTQGEMEYLQELGIGIQDGQALESGVSGVFGDLQGAPPVGFTTEASSNSAPPSFFSGQKSSSVAPSYTEAIPPYAVFDSEQQPASEFFAPTVDVLSPPSIAEPVDCPIQTPPVGIPQIESPPVPATESPPSWEQNWDGPASDISAPPLTTNSLHILNTQPSSTVPVQSTVNITTSDPLVGESIRRISADTSHTTNNALVGSVPTRYTKTTVRQPLTFEPVRSETVSKDPVVAFTAPKRTHTPPPTPPQPQSEFIQLPVDVAPTADSGTFRRIEEQADTTANNSSPIRDTIERYLQSQGRLTESGDPEKMRIAFIHLSQLYEHDQLGEAERALMRPILDALALKVIYSRDTHILEPPYQVKSGETIESIARDFNLNVALLRKINGLTMYQELMAGTVLKVVYGQFDARISVNRKELTLLLGGLYAGRFSFVVHNPEIQVNRSEFFVTHKTDGAIVLNNGWILTTPHTTGATVVFSDQDAREIFDILSEQSVIVVE